MRSIAPAASSRPRRHQPDELRAVHLDARIRASCLDPRDDLVQRAASQSSTFMLTCTSPARGSRSPSARTPGKAAARLADDGGDRPGRLGSAERRLTLKAMSGRRAPTMTPPARWSSRPGRSRGELAAASRAPAPRPAAPEERRASPAADLAVEEDGQAELLADSLGTSSAARGAIHVVGRDRHERHDVAAPMRGWAPSCRRRSIRPRLARRPRRARPRAPRRRRRACRPSGGGPGPCGRRGAAPRPPSVADRAHDRASRPSETFGTARAEAARAGV